MEGECSWVTVCMCQSHFPWCGSVAIFMFFPGCACLTVRCDENDSSVLGSEALRYVGDHLWDSANALGMQETLIRERTGLL